LVSFDDILVYNKTWQEHMRHLDEVLSIMETQSLHAKESKCEFDMIELLYLGHMRRTKFAHTRIIQNIWNIVTKSIWTNIYVIRMNNKI
jgi:hypothetical protein